MHRPWLLSPLKLCELSFRWLEWPVTSWWFSCFCCRKNEYFCFVFIFHSNELKLFAQFFVPHAIVYYGHRPLECARTLLSLDRVCVRVIQPEQGKLYTFSNNEFLFFLILYSFIDFSFKASSFITMRRERMSERNWFSTQYIRKLVPSHGHAHSDRVHHTQVWMEYANANTCANMHQCAWHGILAYWRISIVRILQMVHQMKGPTDLFASKNGFGRLVCHKTKWRYTRAVRCWQREIERYHGELVFFSSRGRCFVRCSWIALTSLQAN